jgi:glycine/D-amino acid oxidase-like deaminating enzyme
MSGDNAVDLAIVGGGVAGLWLANLFASRGYRIILLEGGALGGAQTLASQGIIHGGLKYSLSGALSSATVAISTMPRRWRDNLEGQGELDLRPLTPLAERCHLFAQDAALDRLSSFLASKAMRGRSEKLQPRDYPQAFKHPDFSGVVYAVDDLIIDTPALIQVLHKRVADRAFHHQLQSSEVEVRADHVLLKIGNRHLHARHLLLCAGAGNGPLLQGLGLAKPQMQLRPLHQVIVRHAQLEPLFAHCLSNVRRTEPRITITSHWAPDGLLWYLGGQLGGDGVGMAPAALAAHARRELSICVPWLDWQQARIESLSIDRAEPLDPRGNRPDQAFVEAHGPLLVCWPTKLSLTPDLGDRVRSLLAPPDGSASMKTNLPALGLEAASVGRPPWEK